MAQLPQRYILQWSKLIAPKVKHLAFTREEGTPLPFKAGQFMTLNIPGPTKTLHRSYSIANRPGKDNLVEIAISYVEGGVASELLFNLKPGDSVMATGPYGLFVLKEETPKRYVLISTGTGISPYRSMLDEIQERLKETQKDLKVVVVQGVRNQAELLFGDDFITFANTNPNFTFYACYSRETKTALAPYERLGHVQTVFKELTLDPEHDIVYLCGNPFMIDDTFAQLTAMGFDKKNVRREKYGFSH